MHRIRVVNVMAGLSLLSIAVGTAFAQSPGDSGSPLRNGAYLAPLASYTFNDDDAFDDGPGVTLAAGYRMDWWAIEAAALFANYDGANGSDTDVVGGTLNALLFPFSGLPNLFGIVGVGGLEVDRHPTIDRKFSLTTAEIGAGYLLPLGWGRYDYAVRADARYRYGHRERRVNPGGDLDIPTSFKDAVLHIGLQLPLGLRPPPPPPTPAPRVVPPVAPPTPPPAPEPVCKTPQPGEVLSLDGCGTGHVVVLHGVNFAFDSASVEINARHILDGVAAELNRHEQIEVEISGHTDSRGADTYNQRLSERRAQSVVTYLASKGVSGDRMTAVGHGENRPVADNDSDAGRELNRRVELRITRGAANGRPATAPRPAATQVEVAPETPSVTPDPAPEAVAAPTPTPTSAPPPPPPPAGESLDFDDDEFDDLFDF